MIYKKDKVYHLYYDADGISKMDVVVIITGFTQHGFKFNPVFVNNLTGVFKGTFVINIEDSYSFDDISGIKENGGKFEVIGDSKEYPEYFI